MSRWALVLSLTIAGCVSPRVAALETRLAQAEADILALQSRSQGVVGAAAAPDAAREEAAAAILKRATDAAERFRFDEAKLALDELTRDYAGSGADVRAKRLRTEIGVIGRPAGVLEVDHWLQGTGSFDGPGATLVVFAEEWCPHCKREVPNLEGMSRTYAGRMQILGLTKLTKSSTEEKMRAFLLENHVTYPFAVEKGGTMSARFEVTGIPAAVLIRDGAVLWRGHPARLTDEALEQLLAP